MSNTRIAIILNGHTGATFPLIDHLLQKDYEVDLYYNSSEGGLSFVEGLETEFIPLKKKIKKISVLEAPAIYNYFNSEKFNLYLFSFPRPFDHAKPLHIITYPRLYFAYRNFARFLNEKKYQWINIITRYEVSCTSFLIRHLNPCPTISLHEVCNHYEIHNNGIVKEPHIYKAIRDRRCNVVLYSNNTLRDIQRFNITPENLFRINFGLFETYKTCVKENQLTLPDKYILFIGTISNYKGLDLLYGAIDKISQLRDYKIVVAGKGKVPILDTMKGDNRYVVINRYLSNSEFTELVRRSSFIVCPYKTMSQSGIPQTAFLFSKPIVASDLDGFKELITDGENGILFKSGDNDALTEAIENMLANYHQFEKNAYDFLMLHPDFSWHNIIAQYEKLFLNK